MSNRGPADATETEFPSGSITLTLTGRFAMVGPEGEILTPKAAKEQALIALLATSKNGERGRAWLQDKLWSDRGPKQASDSLRQALAGLRRLLGPWRAVLETDRQSARLNLAVIDVMDLQNEGEFLEGIDVRDQEFEEWLANERSRRHQPLVMPMVSARLADRRAVLLLTHGTQDDALATTEAFFIDAVSHTLRETLNIDVYTKPAPQPIPGLLVARVQALRPTPDMVALRVRAESGETSRILWSGRQTIRADVAFPYEDIDILTLGNQLVSALADHLLVEGQTDPDRRDATLLGLAGLKLLFTMNEDQVHKASRNFADAYELDPRGIFLSWQAQLRGIQLVERHAGDAGELIETGIRMAEQAIRLDPINSMVLATASNARLILARDAKGARELSQQSVEANLSNPLGWWALSAARLYEDDAEDAYTHAMRGQRLATGSPFRFWWDMQSALCAAVSGRTDEAINMAERCAAMAPDFRPPLRYLIALYASKGDYEQASRKVQRLIELEPDFTPERLAYDPTYPVSLMRRTNLLDPAKLLELE